MSKNLWWIGCFFIILHLSSFWVSGIDDFNQAFPIIEPDPGHTKLRLSSEGLEAIRRITNPIAAVAVIGPYRSGKSFLLNQLLSLSCYEGFGVGHMRDTKTKGIWVWGTPVEMDIDGVKTSVFYLDTEGFESIGKSNVYDDRIFALATVLSSVLIYNLPETIREADISRLSFAVELAEEFYGRVKGQDVAFEPAKLLWLIQRDFLQGKSVKEMVDEALRHVPNHDGDKNIDQVNQIRDSLAIMGDNSTAFSLPQDMSGHCTVDEFSSLRNDRAWYNLTFVMVELIWHDVEGKRLVIIFLDQNRQKIVAIVPQDLIHLYNDDTLMGGFFSLNHFQIENLNYHEYPKYHNYLLVCSEKKIVINEYTKLLSLELTIPRGACIYPLVPSIIKLKHDRRPKKFIVDVVGRIIEGKRDRCCFELSLRDKTGHTIQMFLSTLKPSDVICTILAVQRKSIIYVSRVKFVHLPDINILKSTELSRITYDPDMLEARDI